MLAGLLVTTAACSGPAVGPSITSAVPEPITPAAGAPAVPDEQAVPVSLGPAPEDIRSVDWLNTPLPGAFCAVDGLVPFRAGEAMAESTTYGEVHLIVEDITYGDLDGDGADITYGDLDGDGREEAVIGVGCDNNGGTASGQLGFGAVVVQAHRDLRAIGTITPQMELADATHVTLLSELRIEPGQVVADEMWYRDSDMTCCPTGKAVTTWKLESGRLTAGPPAVTA